MLMKKGLAILLSVAFFSIVAAPVYAAGDINAILEKIFGLIYGVALVLAPLMIVVSAFMFLTAGGAVTDKESPKKLIIAKQALIGAIVGLLIAVIAKELAAMIQKWV